MSSNIIVIISAMIINFLLSLIAPCLLKDMDQPFIKNMKQVFTTNKQLILSSTLIVGIVTYLALQISPLLEDQFSFIQDYQSNSMSMSGMPIDDNTLRVLLNLSR